MSHVKTAISLQETLLERIDELAREMSVSRSHLFAIAAEEYLQRHRNQDLLERINQAFVDAPDPSELDRLHSMKRSHRKIVEGEW